MHPFFPTVITVNWEMSIQCPKCQVIPATLKRVTTVSVYSLHTVINVLTAVACNCILSVLLVLMTPLAIVDDVLLFYL